MDHSVLNFSHKMKVLHIDLISMIERSTTEDEIAIRSFQLLKVMVLLQRTSHNEIHTISSNCLLRLDRNRHGGGVFLHIRDALPYSVTLIGLGNMELPLHNGGSNMLLSLDTVQSFHYSPCFETAVYFM